MAIVVISVQARYCNFCGEVESEFTNGNIEANIRNNQRFAAAHKKCGPPASADGSKAQQRALLDFKSKRGDVLGGM